MGPSCQRVKLTSHGRDGRREARCDGRRQRGGRRDGADRGVLSNSVGDYNSRNSSGRQSRDGTALRRRWAAGDSGSARDDGADGCCLNSERGLRDRSVSKGSGWAAGHWQVAAQTTSRGCGAACYREASGLGRLGRESCCGTVWRSAGDAGWGCAVDRRRHRAGPARLSTARDLGTTGSVPSRQTHGWQGRQAGGRS